MNILWDSWNAVAGANSEPSQSHNHMAADTINRLCSRVASSDSIEDRRDSVRALRALAGEYQLEVGTQSMDILVQVLGNDRSELSIIQYALETFIFIFATNESGDGPIENDIGVGFTEIFVKKTEYVGELVDLLTLQDFHVRHNVVQILLKLLANKCSKLQEALLAVPQGIAKLMDLLDDPRPPMQNNILLLLIRLTRNNPLIQQIVVFENAFGRILDIIQSSPEGIRDTNVVIQDSLLLMYNLLKSNVSNQNHFRETCCIRRCNPILESLLTSDNMLSKQDNINYLRLISILRVLVVQSNPNVNVNQTAVLKQGTFAILAKLSMSDQGQRLPPSLKVQLRCTVADCMRRNNVIQEMFDYTITSDTATITSTEITTPSNSTTDATTADTTDATAAEATENSEAKKETPIEKLNFPGLDILITDLLNTHSSFSQRAASLYCLGAFVYQYPAGRKHFLAKVFKDKNTVPTTVATGAPQTSEDFLSSQPSLILERDPYSFVNSLFNTEDVMSMWLSFLALSSAIRSGPEAKLTLINLSIALDSTSSATPFMERLIELFVFDGAHKVRVWTSCLIFLSTLFVDCPTSVNRFLSSPSSHSFLVQQSQQTPTNFPFLSGLTSFVLGLCTLYNDDSSDVCKKETLLNDIVSVIKFDKFKHNIKTLTLTKTFTNAAENFEIVSTEADAGDVYFDYEFTVLCKKLKDEMLRFISRESQSSLKENSEQNVLAQQYRQLIRAQDDELQNLQKQISALLQQPLDQGSELDQMKREVEELRVEVKTLSEQRIEEERTLAAQLDECVAELNEVSGEQEDLLMLLEEQDVVINELKERITGASLQLPPEPEQ